MFLSNFTKHFGFFSLLFLLAGSYACQDDRLVNGAVPPDIVLNDINGQSLPLSSIQTGKIVIIDFWASWCKPCIETHERFKELYEKYKDTQIGEANGLTIYSVSLDNKPEAWQKALEKYDIPWPHQVNEPLAFGSPYTELYQFEQIPTFYVIDERGVIIGKNLTYKWLDYELRRRMGEV